jgi:hypothetical protein
MTDWLAIIVICAGSECAFWADTKTAYATKADCEQQVKIMTEYFLKNDIQPVISTCLPIRFTRI